ncbi:hypothetical protein [Microbacterium sp. MM2322]|uniref:hypothetical protein n=1 Tax=Microbacterium sp. MM2322 TaxID=3157631 RepID=UPI0032D5A7D7
MGAIPGRRDNASAAARPASRRFRGRGIVTAGLLLCAGLAISLASGGLGTYALLDASSPAATGSATLTTGTAELTVSSVAMPTDALYPGKTATGPVTVANTGSVPLSIAVSGLTTTVATSPFLSALTFSLGATASGQSCAVGSISALWTGTLASPKPGPTTLTLPAGQSRVLCLSTTLPLTAAASTQGQPATPFALHLTGTQT